MAQLELAGNMYEVDENGFLHLRNYYLEYHICPMVRKLTKQTGVNLKRLYELFPQGPANSACKWAGVPKPTGCV